MAERRTRPNKSAKKAKESKPRKEKPSRPSIPAPDPVPPPPKPEARDVGRPSKYTQELADRICAGLAEGQSMRTVLSEDGMPAMRTVFYWLRTNEEFLQQYARAKQEAADAFAEEILDIADDGRNDWMEKFGKDGEAIGWMVNGEAVQRSRVRVDTRKWLASKLKPKKYGDKLELGGSVTKTVRIVNMTGVKIGSGEAT